MDRVPVSETVDAGSIPAGSTMDKKYVSRAGEKLEAALEHFKINTKDLVCLDVGCSTGGFTDCLLQKEASKIFAMDTGYGVLDWKLRNNPQVVVMERTNLLYIESFPELLDLAVVDTSWTRLKLSVPAASRFVKPNGIILALIKPQYEAPKSYLKRGVLIPEKLDEVVEGVRTQLTELGFVVSSSFLSPVIGSGGNREYWVKLGLVGEVA